MSLAALDGKEIPRAKNLFFDVAKHKDSDW